VRTARQGLRAAQSVAHGMIAPDQRDIGGQFGLARTSGSTRATERRAFAARTSGLTWLAHIARLAWFVGFALFAGFVGPTSLDGFLKRAAFAALGSAVFGMGGSLAAHEACVSQKRAGRNERIA
jgi:hypothetical protein